MRYKIKFLGLEKILKITSGEVIEPKFINKRTFLPIPGGLFCQKIFGPLEDYTCSCSPEKRVYNKGLICSKCGIQFIKSSSRRTRSGFVKLATPHVHPLSISLLAQILQVDQSKLNGVITGKLWMMWKEAASGAVIIGDLPQEIVFSETWKEHTKMGRSPKILYELIRLIDLQKTFDLHENNSRESETIEESLSWRKSARFMERCLEESLRLTDLFITHLPIMPPDLRPLTHKGTKVIMNPKNELYKNLMWRRNRLRYTQDPRWINYPSLVKKDLINIEASSSQVALEKLLIGGFKTINKIPIKSLLQDLTKKEGHIRNKMLGKRVDYSGRSVITPGPHLSLDEVGLPRQMAVILFRLWIAKLLREKYHYREKKIKRLLHQSIYEDPFLHQVLDEVIEDMVIIINRQPTLHRMGMFGLKVKLHDGKSILLHPMICAPTNSDFDGDTVAVHAPISEEALRETRDLMFPVDNILSPLDGMPIFLPSHEMVIGAYNMTKINEKTTFKTYLSKERAIEDYDRGIVGLSEPVEIRTPARFNNNDRPQLRTCVGRLLIEELFQVPIETPITKKSFQTLVSTSYDILGKDRVSIALDSLKELTYDHVTQMGFSLGMDDFVLPSTRQKRMGEAHAFSEELKQQKESGVITEEERAERKTRKWMETIEHLQDDFVQEAGENNPLVTMLNTGARVSMAQVSQLIIAKGMQASAKGKILEDPIQNCLKTRLTPGEFFLSCYGARKSMADKKMVTPLAGYLARRLVNAARDLYISEEDCEYTKEGVEIRRCDAFGRTNLSGILFDEKSNSKEYVTVRSPIFCKAENGICSACYGQDLSKRLLVAVGTPVGVIAAQSLTEPCTQLALRSFHLSGAAELKDNPRVLYSKNAGEIYLEPHNEFLLSIYVNRNEKYIVHRKHARLLVEDEQTVSEGTPLAVYISKNFANEDIRGTLVLLDLYFEARKIRQHPAIIAKESGIVDLQFAPDANSDKKNEGAERGNTRIAVYVNGKEQGISKNAPVFVHNGEFVRKGQFLSYGEASLLDYKDDLECSANVFTQRVQTLYNQENIYPSSSHIEMIFRAMTELVETEEGEFGLYRQGDPGERRLMGVTSIGKKYPSWLKRIEYGFVKEGLQTAVENFEVSRDLPSERLLEGQFPLFDIPTSRKRKEK